MEITEKQRLKQFIKFKRISNREFERNCKLSNGYVTSKSETIRSNYLTAIAEVYPELNIEWLLHGTGKMINENLTPYKSEEKSETFTTLLVPLSATGGTLADYDEPGALASQCEKISIPIAADLAIPITGDSMEPEYPNGSIVLVKKIDPSLYIEWGEVYVIDSLNGRVVKEVRRASDTAISCVSRNRPEQYAPFNIELSTIRGMYRVLMVMSRK